jgi:hypothetical protein
MSYDPPAETKRLESTGQGLMFGVVGSVPIKDRFGLYGALAYGALKTKYSESADLTKSEYTTPYYLGEVGISYALPINDGWFRAGSISLGYRFQRYEFKDFTYLGQTARDGTDGFVLGVHAIF